MAHIFLSYFETERFWVLKFSQDSFKLRSHLQKKVDGDVECLQMCETTFKRTSKTVPFCPIRYMPIISQQNLIVPRCRSNIFTNNILLGPESIILQGRIDNIKRGGGRKRLYAHIAIHEREARGPLHDRGPGPAYLGTGSFRVRILECSLMLSEHNDSLRAFDAFLYKTNNKNTPTKT